jgi:hypothetical protein
LQGLDAAAWNFLKSELEPLLTAQDAKRGWQPLWDRLNQAKAYNHLKDARYRNIEFISPSTVRGQQTLDLRAELNTTRVLCEVKTIDISEIEAERRHSGGAGSTSDRLDSALGIDVRGKPVLSLTASRHRAWSRRVSALAIRAPRRD